MKTLVLLLASITSLNLIASDVIIKSADLQNAKGPQASLKILHAGIINDNPRISINDKILNIVIPNSGLGSKINKKTNVNQNDQTVSLHNGERVVKICIKIR